MNEEDISFYDLNKVECVHLNQFPSKNIPFQTFFDVFLFVHSGYVCVKNHFAERVKKIYIKRNKISYCFTLTSFGICCWLYFLFDLDIFFSLYQLYFYYCYFFFVLGCPEFFLRKILYFIYRPNFIGFTRTDGRLESSITVIHLNDINKKKKERKGKKRTQKNQSRRRFEL